MNVIYTTGARLGSGIGYTAQMDIECIKKAGFLKQAITGDDIQIQSNDSILKDNAFDVLASTRIASPVDIGHFWGNMAYSQIIKVHNLGGKTIVQRASSHISTQNHILLEEFKRFGYNSVPIHPWVIKKSLAEFKETNYVTVPSQFAYNSFIDENYPETKLLLNPFGVDTEKFHPMELPHDDTFKVAFFGENWIRKGLYFLLKAWNELNLKNAKLFVRSSNPPFFNDIDYATINYISWVEDIVRFYNTLDLFCLPTLEDGNALVIGELASCGIPSITTPNSGTWLDEKSCFFIPIRDIDALKNQLQYCYDNREELKKIGREARRKAEENTWDHYGKRLIKKYSEIVN
jgi:glycosyltransferase involved in cell wall biosynthesis